MYKNKYLSSLSNEFPNIQSASSEYINLNAILNLPKGTEYFIADIHGEYETFNHLIKNASGIIREKVKLRFPNKPDEYQNRLAFFIYYPNEMLERYKEKLIDTEFKKLLNSVILDMVALARLIVSKYTQNKVRSNLPEEFRYIMMELLYESRSHVDKKYYYEAILSAIFKTKREGKLIVELSRIIRLLAIDQLHIVGDIFDRGAYPHLVMDKLITRRNVDIQWGNHDIIWMGAASGCKVSLANVIRIAARYNNLSYLEDGYGINLRPLVEFADSTYKNVSKAFLPKDSNFDNLGNEDKLVAKVHKAISLIQFKLESRVINRNPEFELNDRLLLDKIDYEQGVITLDGRKLALSDNDFPTISMENPFELSAEELKIVDHLKFSFLHNEKLQKHIKYMFQHGSMYLVTNNALCFHACIPMTETGEFEQVKLNDKLYSGKSLLDMFGSKIRQAYLNRYEKNNPDRDYFVYLWQGANSPLFGKLSMKTFERYFVDDKETSKEVVNPYFNLREDDYIIDKILNEFGINEDRGRVVNGHIPLDITEGHEVVLASKRLYLIDGGMSHQYDTNIGGYTLISDSNSYILVSNDRFKNHFELVEVEKDVVHTIRSEDLQDRRTYIYDTDTGRNIQEKINDLKELIDAYRSGEIKERTITHRKVKI